LVDLHHNGIYDTFELLLLGCQELFLLWVQRHPHLNRQVQLFLEQKQQLELEEPLEHLPQEPKEPVLVLPVEQ